MSTGKTESSVTTTNEMGLEQFGDETRAPRRPRPTATYREAARDIPVLAETDVLVVEAGRPARPQPSPRDASAAT